jgi:hypothetical protein
LRHTTPSSDRNQARWPTSPLWVQVQQARFFGDGVPAVRERKTAGDLLLICQMLAGCSTTASALLTNAQQARALLEAVRGDPLEALYVLRLPARCGLVSCSHCNGQM